MDSNLICVGLLVVITFVQLVQLYRNWSAARRMMSDARQAVKAGADKVKEKLSSKKEKGEDSEKE